MLNFQLIALSFLPGFKDGIAGVQIQAMMAGNQTQHCFDILL